MTIKDAILKSLEDLTIPTSSVGITEHILKNEYCPKLGGETPQSTVSAICGDFSRLGDARVKRIKEKGTYFYYLAKNQNIIDIEGFEDNQNEPIMKNAKNEKDKTFTERDLHKLLSSFLKAEGIYTKTIFHEQSSNKESNQIWTHPDMVGIKLLSLQNKISRDLLKAIKPEDAFKLFSYELKKEINNDSELKKAFFQAVSNSSWANYGYLVAFEISDTLSEEMERLNQSFGIGIIELKADPFKSIIKYQAKYRELDFKTIDKSCKVNKDFEKFIEQTEKLMNAADERYYDAIKTELNGFCDGYLTDDTEVLNYCKDKNIPIEESSLSIS